MPVTGLGGAVDFRLLGPVELWHDDRRVELGHARQRCVLAVLLVEAGQVVPAATLLDRVWGHEPPDGGLSVLYAYVTRLRKVLAPVGVRLAHRSRGYLLDIDPQSVDLHRFQRLVGAAEATGDLALVDAALDLWRGTPFADLTGPWLGKVRESLLDQRLSALLDRNEAALRAGQAAELVTSLRALVAEYPTDERPVGQLMLALYRSGRSAEAFEHYDSARRRLASRCGSEPGPYLRDLHHRMLRDDPSLMPGRTVTFPNGQTSLEYTVGRYRQALAIAREIGDRQLEDSVLHGLVQTRQALAERERRPHP
jgi:DNA-binding SARP family transcriptional activator